MNDKEILTKFHDEIKNGIEEVYQDRSIKNTYSLEEFATEYKANFIRGFHDGMEKEKIKITKAMLEEGDPIDKIM